MDVSNNSLHTSNEAHTTERHTDYRICHLELDPDSIGRRSADVEQERRIAVFDLLDNNNFQPLERYHQGYHGPYSLTLSLQQNNLILHLQTQDQRALSDIALPLLSFKRLMRDYFTICESYYSAIKVSSPSQIETIDMARRGLHNEASELLIERFKDKAVFDFDTARRLFTLLCSLSLK